MKIPVDVFYSVIDDANKAKQKHQEELRQYEAELQKFWQQYQQEWKAKGIHPEFAARAPGVANVLAAINQALAPTAGMLDPQRMKQAVASAPDLPYYTAPVIPAITESVPTKAFGRTLMSAAQRLPGMRSLDAPETGIQWLDTATQFAGATLGEIGQLMAGYRLATPAINTLMQIAGNPAVPPLVTSMGKGAIARTIPWVAHRAADPESTTAKDLGRSVAFGLGAGAASDLTSTALRHAFPGIHPLIEAPITGAATGAAGAAASYPFSDKKGMDYLKEMGATILAQAILQTVWTAGSPQTWKPRQNFYMSMARAQKYYDDIFEALEGNNQRAANIAYREFQKSMDNALHYAHQGGAPNDPALGAPYDPALWRAWAEDLILQGFKMRGWTPHAEAPTPEPATGPAAIPAPKPELPSPVAPQAPAAPVAEPTAPAVQPVMPEPVVKPPAPPDAITAPEKAAPIQSPSPAPISEPEPMPALPEKVPDVSPEATKTVTIKAPVNRLTANAADLAADYKARGIEKQAAYTQFVRDRQLKPEMDAKAFFKIFDSVSPALLQGETQTVGFKPTHIDTVTNTPVMASISPDGASWNIIWENGMTGSEPVDPIDGAGFDDRFKPIEAETQPETSEPTAPKPTTTETPLETIETPLETIETPLETIETPQSEEVAGLPIAVSPDDINLEMALNAYRAISFEPEKRARQTQQDYVNHMQSVYDELAPLAKTPEQQDILKEELERYRQGYLKRMEAILSAKSKTMSPMITGPANFPTARNQKWLNIEMKRINEMQEWKKKAQNAIKKKLTKARTPQRAGDAEAEYERLKNIIDSTIDTIMIATLNGIETGELTGYDYNLLKLNLEGAIKSSIDNGNFEAAQKALDYLREAQKALKKPIYTNRHSIWSYAEKKAAKIPARAATGKQVVAEYEGAQVVNNFDEKRVQIFFDGKPSKEIRDAMKKAAWKWSPSAGAWQRKNTPNAIASANMILSKHLGAPAKPAESHAAPTAEVQHEPEVPASEPAREPLPPVEPATTGKRVTVKTERGTAVDVEYAIIEADSLISSHNTALRKDPRFPEELQPRERARTASEAQITRIANMLEPEFLGESPKASEGAPIIGPDGVVESGNARVIALKRVYEEGKPGAAKYKAWLAANADRFGLDRATLENMESPVLVRIRKTDLDREQFVREANEAAVAAMSATEQAMADAKRMSGSLMTLFRPNEDGEINTVANRDFIRVFMDKVVGPTEQGRYMTADGVLSQEGIARIRNAVFARAYGDPTAMAKLAESPDNNVRNVTGAMLIVAPRLADIKERIEAGHLFDLDITEDIAAAMKKLSELREQGMSVKEYLMQMTMFEEELSPFAKELLATFEKYRRSRKKITELLHAYADTVIAAGDPKQQVLFGERTPPTKKEVLEAAIRAMEVRYGERDIQGSLFGGEASGIRREAIAETGAGEVGGRRESAEGHVTAGGEAKSLAEAEQELRLKVDDVIDEVIPPVGTSVTIVGKSKGKDAEVKTKLTFTDPEIEARWQAAKGIRGPSATEKLKDFLVSLYHKATREFELLPRGAEFAKIQFALRKLQKQRDVASDRTLRIQQGLTIELNEPQFDLFTRAVILADLQHSADKQEELPFGFTQESLAKEKKRIDDAVSKDPAVLEAIRNRRKVWDALKRDYIESMEEIGFNVEDRLKREDYFRHQVLMYAQVKSISGTGKKLRTPTGRGFLKKREGSELDINTDYLQAEYEVMAQMIYDIEVAKTIKVVDDEHNIVDKLKAQATEANTRAIMRELEKSAKLLQGNVSAATLYRKLNQKQAIGISKLAELAANGELPVGPNGEWEDVVDALAENHEENALARQAMKEFGRKPDDPEYAWAYLPDEIMPRLLKYASWILKQKEEGSSAAATLFKGIQEKRKYIQDTLGEEYLTWRDLIPEGYTIWQPREGSVFYMSNSIPAQLAEALTTGLLEKVGITKEDLKHVVVLGGPRREFVIKEELASTLDNLIPPRSNNVIEQVAKSITNKLKVWYLLSPQRWVKYNIRNLSGDAEAVFLGNPSAFKKVPQAWRELYQVYFGDRAMTPDMQAWFERGGMQSTLQVQEMGDINQLKMFKQLHDAKGTAKEIPLKAWQGYWKAARLSTDFRESILRYAAFLDYLEQMKADPKGRPKNYGASIPEEVDALDDIYDKAFMLSNDLLGAYDRVSVLGKNIRERLALFWSFQEVNFKRYIQLWKNIGQDPRAAEKAGRAVLGQAVKKTSPFLIMAAGKFILKALAFWGAMTAYNYIFHRDSERESPPDLQARPHIVLGRDKNGKIRYFDKLGILEDFLKWFGLNEAPLLVKDFLNGRRSLGDIARHIARAPVNEMVQQLTPLIKTPIEMLTERKLYPDAFSPGRIRDPWLYIAQSLGIEPEYRALGKGPKLPYSERLEGLLTYKVDPGEAAYWYVIDEKNRWLDKQGKRFIGVADSAKSLALYNLKLALRYDDKKAVQKYMAEYYAAGGTYEGMNTSLKSMHPLSGLSKEDEWRFIEWLYKDPDGKERLERAIDHYYDLLGRM